MKRELIDFLNTDLQFIKGVGPVLAARFDDVLGGRRVLDFLLHRPAYVRARDITDNVMDATPGDVITIPLLVKSHKSGGVFRGRRRPTQILCNDKMGNAVVIQFFNVNYLDYWLKKLPIGDWRMISGKLERGARPTISHPDFIEEMQNASKIPSIQAIYPAGEGLTQKVFANVRDKIFEILPDKLCGEDEERVLEFFDALQHIHFPTSADDLMPNATYMAKLAYCELFAHQSAIVISRRNRADVKNRRVVRPKKYDLMEKFYAALPFEMTGAQSRTCDEIFDDLQKNVPMMRLVQGDVGSGKTIVALAAAVKMAETGAATALLAPTDTLAQQHFAKLKPMCDKIGIVCDILTGRDKGVARREKLISLKSGRTRLVVGTHALFSADVEYRDLGLVIIDEQHRFGVAQREALRQKGNNPDLLALSATPIPRTLSMTMYGDMDVSIINEKPAGRKPIKTTKLPMMRINELVGRLQMQIATGAKVFWVCPLVEESENGDANMTAVVERHKMLCQYFPTAGLVHGQMDKKQRDTVMEKFADNDSDMRILVATTVIEVGIDVPRASIIVIENAERFGLAALHQLRGRVGRGNTQSYCVLIFGNNLSDDGIKRLDVLCETDDGFVIAEQDLMMRGVGELMGTRQSGWIQYHFVDYREHRDLFKLAANAARDNDADEWTRDLMYIFDRGVIQGA
ncbi:MAG: ATP-dependent DNA helicase RecG [Alphaproteobacteria bacterium]|nr:ATP-dependent DNA helicase RecG [Alphaproteobacteria bacterium]MBQ7127526.1 ATP-dependent DNA helicase RecG [Alphaproteobacteria bacterium]